MMTQTPSPTLSHATIVYPESDGQPMADNTKQFRWITVIQYNLDWLFAQNDRVFVAGDLLWYPVEGDNKLRQAPDVMVIFGVPKGERGSYQQWKENHIAPQVVFEILSPGNTLREMHRKQLFYDRYGVEEYYIYDPDRNDLSGWLRRDDRLDLIETMTDWISPRLGIRFAWIDEAAESLQLFHPNGTPFSSYAEVSHQLQEVSSQLEDVSNRLEDVSGQLKISLQTLEQEKQRAEQEKQRADRLAEQLRALGLTPD